MADIDLPLGSRFTVNRDDRQEILNLTDHALEQHNHYRALALATDDLAAWRLAEACRQDRETLLERLEVGGE